MELIFHGCEVVNPYVCLFGTGIKELV